MIKTVTDLKNNRRLLYALAAVVFIALLAAWYWHSYGGRGETDAVIDHLCQSTATAERRADAVVDATCLLYTSPSPRDISGARMPSSA